MHLKLTCKQPALVNRKGSVVLHDNARLLVSMITHQKLHLFIYEVLDHPRYSPDLSSTEFHFFKHLDNFLQEKCFRNPKNAEMVFTEFVATTTFYDTSIKKTNFSFEKVY